MYTNWAQSWTPDATDVTDATDDSSVPDDVIPINWVRVAKTDTYIRLLDGVTMKLCDAVALETSSSVKQEHYLSLAAIVKFYQERVEYCTEKQADALLEASWQNKFHLSANSSLKFSTRTTKAVYIHLDMDMHTDVHITAHMFNLNHQVLVNYKLHENPDQFPTARDLIRHIPGLYHKIYHHLSRLGCNTNQASAMTETDIHNCPTVFIQDSILSTDVRQTIIELDEEEAELNHKLDDIRKRKHELEEAGRNVRKCS